jgi:molybdopterin-containing oxidoreductase family iron-sulfur binding subunit
MAVDQTSYWKSLAERDGEADFLATLDREFVSPLGDAPFSLHRRNFLKAAGFFFTGAVLSGCQRTPERLALPQVSQPSQQQPGRPLYYATTCGGCNAGCGVLAKTVDGRPIKLEGNPEHPLSQGGLCAIGQASLLGLYDSLRLQRPLKDGQPVAWSAMDEEIRNRLPAVNGQESGARRDGAVRVLSRTIISPTLRDALRRFVVRFTDGRHIEYDALSCSAILDAHLRTHGVRVLPHYRLDLAAVIVGFDADFLGTWVSPVEFTAAYAKGRNLEGSPPRMSFHVQVESRLTVTGSKADQRIAIAPGEIGLALTHLASRLASRAGVPFPVNLAEAAPVPATVLDDIAERLWQAREQSLLLCGTQDLQQQLLCNFINDLLGNYDATLDTDQPSLQYQGNDAELPQLLEDMRQGKVAALFVLDCNPVYELPDGEAWLAALKKVPLVVCCAERLDETTVVARYVVPHPHYLASWGDAEPVSGQVSLTQPTMRPLGDCRPILESLAAWSGDPRPALAQIQDYWQQHVFPSQTAIESFQSFWDQTLHDGHAVVAPSQPALPPFNPTAVRPVLHSQRMHSDQLALVLYPNAAIHDGRHAYNPWLQELPDPISKVTWDNYTCLSPATAAALQLTDGDVVRLETPATILELPVHVQVGQHNRVVAVALGYGSLASARFAKIGPQWLQAHPTVGPNGLVGSNAAPLLTWSDGRLQYAGTSARLVKTGRRQPLACTQTHHSLNLPDGLAPSGQQRRPMIQEAALGEPSGVSRRVELPQAEHADLWPPDHQNEGGHRWGMVIDLQACTGCSACVVACQAENNIPVVGKDEVARHREMHWLRVDRYFSKSADALDVAFQPMMCQHCGNAPCETVCPVLATVHSSEGLNQQVYNRCVGTRYCANNCPYKVRRFNWFAYAHNDSLQNLVLNPDVTVRSRGVMEKCTFCIQRIQEAKLEARRLGVPLADGQLQTACQQSCPAKAIVFGDLHNPNSKVSKLAQSRRGYKVLAELNVQPSVTYLSLLRNR